MEQLTMMLQNVKPGLFRRCSIGDPFRFQDYSRLELGHILKLKRKFRRLRASEEAKNVAIEVLESARRSPKFGNVDEVQKTLSKVKTRYQTKQSTLPGSTVTVFK